MASREIVSAFELQPRRDLTLLHATSLVVGITIGTGIFLKSAVMAQAVGPDCCSRHGLLPVWWRCSGL